MRHPDAQSIYTQCRHILNKVLEELGIPQAPVVTHDQGWVNVCYEVDGALFVRMNARDPELPKFHREAAVFGDQRVRSQVPVPHVVAHWPTRWAYPVLVTRALPGKNLAQRWPTLPAHQRSALARDAGRTLAALHAIPALHGCGDPHDPAPSWPDHVMARAQRHLADARDLDLIDDKLTTQIIDFIEHSNTSLHISPHMCLVHRDFHFGNLLYEGDAISGVVDFEWCEYGDRMRDMETWRRVHALYPGSDAFTEGYGAGWIAPHEMTAPMRTRQAIYALLGALEMACVATKFFPAHEARPYVQKINEASHHAFKL